MIARNDTSGPGRIQARRWAAGRHIAIDRVYEDAEGFVYHTPLGDRVLVGAERQLFVESLAMMVDLLTEGDVDFGIAQFDNLQRNQKLVALYSSARGLLRPDEPAPRLTAFIESAVATVFEFAQHQVYDEIDDPEFHGEASHWRKIVLEAARERVEAADMPAEQNAHKTAWSFLIESLAGCVLWDNDYEWQEPLDISPDAGNAVKSVLGMDDAYYTAVPEDPPDNQANLYLDALMGLTAEVR